MRHRMTWVGIGVIVLAAIIICLCFSLLHNDANGSSQTDLYELEFYTKLLYELNDTKSIYIDTKSIYIEDLVPVEWDTMKVFPAYATRTKKIDYVGYEYGNDLQDITHEDVISLVFLLDGKVVYYVDTLVPRMFKIEKNSTEVKLTLKGTSTIVNMGEVEILDGWGYKAEVTETYCQNKPYFDVIYTGKGSIMLTIKNEI